MIQFILLKYSGTILKSYKTFSILVKTEITIFIIWFFPKMKKKQKEIGFYAQSFSIYMVALLKQQQL